MKEKIKYLLGTIWLGVVMFFYYKNHTYYTDGFNGLLKWWPIWLAPILAYGIFLFYNWSKGAAAFHIKLNAKKIAVAFMLCMLLLGNIAFAVLHPIMYFGPTAVYNDDGTVNTSPSEEEIQNSKHVLKNGISLTANGDFFDKAPENIKDYLVKANFWQIESGLIWTFTKVFGTSFLFLVFCYALGSYLHKLIRKKQEHEDSFERKMIELVFGLCVMTTIFYLITLTGHFNNSVNFTVIGILALILLKEIRTAFNKIFSWNLEYEFSYDSIFVPVSIFFLGFLLLYVMDNLSPMPRGWDGLNRYILLARDIAQNGHGENIGSMYAWETILAFFYSIDSKIALFWTSLPGILNFIVMAILFKKFSNNRNTALILAFIVSVPLMSFYMADENKIDLAHWLVGNTIILAVIKGTNFEEKLKVKDYSYFWLAALLSGFAFTVKFTGVIILASLISVFALLESGILVSIAVTLISLAVLALQGGFNLGSEFRSTPQFDKIFIIASLLLSVLIIIFSFARKKLTGNTLKKFLILCALIGLPIIPWMANNYYQTRFEIMTLTDRLITGLNEKPKVDFHTISENCSFTGFFEEFDRYLGYNKNILGRIIEIPWHITMNDTGARGAYVDIGFMFLGFIVFAALFLKIADKRKKLVLYMGFIYALIWLLKANGVIWYGFPILTFSAFIVVFAFDEMNKSKAGRTIILISFAIWAFLAFSSKLNNFGNAVLLMNDAGAITYQQVQENIFPYADDMQSYLEANAGLIYKVGTPLGFYIPDFSKRTYDDQLIDDFYCTYESNKENPLKTIAVLRANNLKYMLFDSYTSTIGDDPNGTLHKKVKTLIDFMNNYLDIVIFDDIRGYHLLYIPSPDEFVSKHPEYKNSENI